MKKKTETTYYFSAEEIEDLTGYLIKNSWGEYLITRNGINVFSTDELKGAGVKHVLETIKNEVLDKTNIKSKFWDIALDVRSQAPEFHSSNPVRILISKSYVNLGLEIEDMEWRQLS